jgi:hypothetical protein
VLNLAVVLICGGLLWYHWPADKMTARIVVVFVVAAAHALYFLLVVDKDSVKAAARTYARQLILSCEAFLTGPASTTKNRKEQSKNKKTPASG